MNRNVETAGRLVHEHEARRGHEIAGDLQSLAHSPGIGPGSVVEPVGGEFRRGLEPLGGGRANAAVVAIAERHQALTDVAAGRTLMRRPRAAS